MYQVYSCIWLLLSAQILAIRLSVDVHGYTNCPGYPPAIDFSNLDFILNNDGDIIINGSFTVLKDVTDPLPMYLYSKRFERGEWREGFGSRHVENFCQTLNTKTEIWYPVMKYLRKQSCPFPKGYVAKFDNFKYGSLPLIIPPNFIGEWAIYMEHRDVTKQKEPLDCAMQYLTVYEV
ncbi:uncharacterized protein LOC134217035 [Armigeres subalbatus]|uniref:uncharacterized protein LOC134217035 n=1 Tax=Armigeres subalbatus TaxID=124917 RepID=UPI002ED16319